MEIDYGLALDFIADRDNRPYQLRFRKDDYFTETGQLIAVIAKASRPDNGHTIPISRADVDFNQVETAIEGWQQWARLTEFTVDLGRIRRRIHAAGLGLDADPDIDPQTGLNIAHDRAISDRRAQLLAEIDTALVALTRAAAITGELLRAYDIELVEGTQGSDVQSFVHDSLRNTRAAYTIVHSIINTENT